MKQIITILLKKDKDIERLRKRFGTNTDKIKPHINIVYPFEIDKKKLENIIDNNLKDITKFNITLNGLKKSSRGYYLYLLVDKGKKDIIKIYFRLHSTELKRFKNKDMPKYIPHLSLGNFKNKKELDWAMKEAKKDKLNIKVKINSIQIVTLNKDDSIKNITKIKLR